MPWNVGSSKGFLQLSFGIRRDVKKLALLYGIYKRRGGVGGMHFNCKAARAHVHAPLADATLVLQCGKFRILEESPADTGGEPKNLVPR
jgi:cytochrome c1